MSHITDDTDPKKFAIARINELNSLMSDSDYSIQCELAQAVALIAIAERLDTQNDLLTQIAEKLGQQLDLTPLPRL